MGAVGVGIGERRKKRNLVMSCFLSKIALPICPESFFPVIEPGGSLKNQVPEAGKLLGSRKEQRNSKPNFLSSATMVLLVLVFLTREATAWALEKDAH